MEKERWRALFAKVRERIRQNPEPQDQFDTPDYPPATEEQLRATEERLGFALPPALWALYAEVMNGGDVFRSGYTVFGVTGAYIGPIDATISHSGWRLNERVDAALQRFRGVYVECEERPEGFVSLSDLGCGIILELDIWTGRLYTTNGGSGLLAYRAGLGLPIKPGMEDKPTYTVEFFLPTVEEWIERECAGEWPTQRHSGPLTQEMLREVDAANEADADGK